MSVKSRILSTHDCNIEEPSNEEIQIEDFVVYARGGADSYWAAHSHGGHYIACEFEKAPKLLCFQCKKEAPPSVRAIIWMLGQWRNPVVA